MYSRMHNHRAEKRARRKELKRKSRNAFELIAFLLIIFLSLVIAMDQEEIRDLRQQNAAFIEMIPAEVYEGPSRGAEERVQSLVYPIYDIPLSKELQRFTYQRCMEQDIDPVMVYAIIETESQHNPELISETDDYGLMQINVGNFDYLMDALGSTNLLDPEQNIEAGIFWLAGIKQNYSDPNQMLMIYNMGGTTALELMAAGRESTWYSREVLRTMEKIRGMQIENDQQAKK